MLASILNFPSTPQPLIMKTIPHFRLKSLLSFKGLLLTHFEHCKLFTSQLGCTEQNRDAIIAHSFVFLSPLLYLVKLKQIVFICFEKQKDRGVCCSTSLPECQQ